MTEARVWVIEADKSALLEVQEYFRLCAAAARASVSRPSFSNPSAYLEREGVLRVDAQ